MSDDSSRHAHPVWFLDGNPIVGYSKLKHEVRLKNIQWDYQNLVRRKGKLERLK